MGKFSEALGDAGAAAGAGALGQVFGLITGGIQDRRQLKQQGKLQDQQIKGSKEMADYNYNKQLEMWKATNYEAQRKELEKAGLNAGLLYGMSGGGGTTVGSGAGAGVGGAQADGGAERTGMGIQLASQLALQKAQKENIEADTANKQAETANKGVQTETGKIDLEIKQLTKYDTVTGIQGAAEKMIHEAEIAGQQSVIAEATAKDKINQIKAEAIGAMIENEAKKSGIEVNNARIREIAAQIQQRWESLRLEGTSQEVSERNMEKLTEAMLWGAGIQATGNLIKGVVDIAGKGKLQKQKFDLDNK